MLQISSWHSQILYGEPLERTHIVIRTKWPYLYIDLGGSVIEISLWQIALPSTFQKCPPVSLFNFRFPCLLLTPHLAAQTDDSPFAFHYRNPWSCIIITAAVASKHWSALPDNKLMWDHRCCSQWQIPTAWRSVCGTVDARNRFFQKWV